MSLIDALKTIEEFLPKDTFLTETEHDFASIKLHLENEQARHEKLTPATVETFLKLLQEHPNSIRFLYVNRNILYITARKLGKLNKLETLTAKGFDKTEIKSFLSKYLADDFATAIDYYFKKEIYHTVTKLLTYQHFLPDETVQLIRVRTEEKIDFLTNKLDKLIDQNPIYKESFFTLTEQLNDKTVNEKVKYFHYVATKYSLEIINTSGRGLGAFFTILSKGFKWQNREPKNIEEKIERKMAMDDFRFVGYFLIGFAAVILVGIIIGLNV